MDHHPPVRSNPGRAVTRQASADPNEAWRFFTALRDALLGAGFTLAFNCRLGVTPAEGTSPDAAPQGATEIRQKGATGFRVPR